MRTLKWVFWTVMMPAVLFLFVVICTVAAVVLDFAEVVGRSVQRSR